MKDDLQPVTIDVGIDAGIEEVWKYYTEPKHITRWNFAADDWHCPHAENDLRVGGKLNARMEAKDGSFGFDFVGIYNEVVSQQKLGYTLDDGRGVSVTFEELNGKTKITLIFDPETENSIEMQKSGWQSILDNFKRYVEQQGK